MKVRAIALLFSLCATAALTSGCGGSHGDYTSYLDGSERVEFKDAKAHHANVSLTAESDADTLQPYYNVTLSFKDGPRQKLTLGFLRDGEFRQFADGAVGVSMNRKTHHFTTESDDYLLAEMIDHLGFIVQYRPRISSRPLNKVNDEVSKEISFGYKVQLALYDEHDNIIGGYEGSFVESTAVYYPGMGEKQPEPKGPATDVFKWLSAKAAAQSDKTTPAKNRPR